jgi:transposase
VARPAKHPVDVKLKIVLSVLAGESTQAEAARRHGVSATSIGKWKEQFLAAGRQGLEHGDRAGKPTGQQARLVDEIDHLTRALGDAHVELRALKRGGPASMGFSLSSRRCASSTT